MKFLVAKDFRNLTSTGDAPTFSVFVFTKWLRLDVSLQFVLVTQSLYNYLSAPPLPYSDLGAPDLIMKTPGKAQSFHYIGQ
jgi:hypothetical protein